ncbi:MAG: O-antigen polysaccharide polymerase Wzy [Rhodospirillales bacterium]
MQDQPTSTSGAARKDIFQGIRWLIAGLVSLVLYVAAVAIVFSQRPDHQAATLILLGCYFVSVLLLMQRALEPLQALPSMFAAFYFAFFFCLPGAVQISANTFQMGDVIYGDRVATRAAAMVAVFLACFVVGQTLVSHRRYHEALATITESERHPRTVSILAFASLAILAGALAIATFGVTALVQTRGGIVDEITRNLAGVERGLMLHLPRSLTLAGLLVMLYAIGRWRREQPAVALLLGWAFLCAVIPVYAITNFPLALARNWQFGTLITFLIVYVKGWRPWLRVGMIAGMLLTMFSLFQWLHVLRRDDLSEIDFQLIDPIAYLKNMDFDGFQTSMNAVLYAKLYGHTLGSQFVSSLLFFVPRGIWPGKGVSSGQMIGEALGYHFTNLSTPFPAEMYLDFSFVGVILGGLVVGYVYRRLDHLCAAAVDFGRPSLHLLLVGLIAGFTIFLMRGSLYAVTNIFVPLLVLTVLLIKAPQASRFFLGFGQGLGRRIRHRQPLPPS